MMVDVHENQQDDRLQNPDTTSSFQLQQPHQGMRHRSSFDISIGGTTATNTNDNDDNGSDMDNNSSDAFHRPLLWNYHQHGNRSDDDEENDNYSAQRISQRHYASTAAICMCTFTHSWLLVSVFPYAGFMVINLVKGTTEETAGTKAGLLSAAFMIGRAITSYGWGRLADTYGRRIVLFVSLVLSAVFSVLFGMSTTFGMAFLWRFFLGASNGVAGIAKAIVSETAKGDDTLETRGMSLSMGMWAWGFLFSPGISGFLSDPIRQYSQLERWLSHDGFLYRSLERFPFILPNLISVVLCLIDIIAVEMWVPETLAKEHLRKPSLMFPDCWHWISKVVCAGIHCYNPLGGTDDNMTATMSALEPASDVKEARMAHSESVSLLSTSAPHLQRDGIQPQSLGSTDVTHDGREVHEKPTLAFLWAKQDTRNHLLLYWIFSFVAIAIDEAFPLFCISKSGGLGISARSIGELLSATGLIFALTQYHAYAWIVDKYGLCKSIQIGAFCSAPLVVLVPFSLLLNTNGGGAAETDTTNTLAWSAFVFLGILLALCRIFGLVFFSSITIATNRTVLPCHRGTMNGLSMLGGSFAKGLGPIAAGWLTAFGISSGTFSPHIGAAFVFIVIGASALLTALMTLRFLEHVDEQEEPSPADTERDPE